MEYLLTTLLVALWLLTIVDGATAPLPVVPGLEVIPAQVKSSADGKLQPLLLGVPASYHPGRAAPLLVGIHTWSAGYEQQLTGMGAVAVERGWLLALPHFRGPNVTSNPAPTEAGGSLLAQRDVLDAVQYMRDHYAVDADRIYLLGGSGGGHMSLLMATKHPELWAGVSAWCPVTDLRDWHEQGNGYAPHIEAVCGGAPGQSPAVDFEYLRRSPRTFITNLANTQVSISHGDRDEIIWVQQTWDTYARLRGLPHQVTFKSWSGGHDMLLAEGASWLAQQSGRPVTPRHQKLVSDEAKWYFWLYVEPAAPLTLAQAEAVFIPATAATAAKPAAAAQLRLRVRDCARVRVRLADLGLGPPTAVHLDSAPLAAEVCPVAAGVLELVPPPGQAAEYVFTF